jgi:hypothetical protein
MAIAYRVGIKMMGFVGNEACANGLGRALTSLRRRL